LKYRGGPVKYTQQNIQALHPRHYKMTANIIEFWKNNRSYWITPPSKQKEVDKLISDIFWNYTIAEENLIGRIIYFDQFYRHFCRHGLITEDDVYSQRQIIVEVIKANYNKLKDFDEIEIIFALMPFKHIQHYDFIFDFLHNHWLPADKKIIDYVDLQKFYIDTYKKAFTLETVQVNLITKHDLLPYDASLICDYYPELYTSSDWNLSATAVAAGDKLLPFLKPDKKVIVSLSGGVDSMVMLSLLKYNKVDVSAVHIVYGNRMESEHEYRLLSEFCTKLSVPLFVYRIKWLKRGEIDRQFYEDMTRDLRFATYHAASEAEPCILMGHIKDDVVENVWTNIAHCHHLGNLKKMEAEEVQLGVRIMRPLLTADKADIYRVSELLGIPYLKNTTPSWSNRGKFREHFHKASVEQFGESIDTKIIEFAEAIQAQSKLLNVLLYEPIYNSFHNNKVNITTAVKANLDAASWLSVFEHICHKYLERSKPSIKCVRDFTSRLYRSLDKHSDKLNVEMGKGLKVQIIQMREGQYIMEFILA
jgi:tRNA(Ile)-lysidine synthetase-like protein